MLPAQIEFLALNAIERVLMGQPIEDSRVELKADYPTEVNKAARQIAGHANAARSEWILWIIGLDEKLGVVGAEQIEHANWLQQVKSQFEHPDLAPRLIEALGVYHSASNSTVVALLFDTRRPPYVVKNASFGDKGNRIEWEVPWREGQRTRSARHADLTQILVPLMELPGFTILAGSYITYRNSESEVRKGWHVNLGLYAETTSTRVVIPVHRCSGHLIFEDGLRHDITSVRFQEEERRREGRSEREPDSPYVRTTIREVILTGPGTFSIRAYAPEIAGSKMRDQVLSVQFDLGVVGTNASQPVSARFELEYEGNGPGPFGDRSWRLIGGG